MMKEIKRLLAWIVSLIMILSVFPVQSFAANGGGSATMGAFKNMPNFVEVDSNGNGTVTLSEDSMYAEILSGGTSNNGSNKVAAIWSELVPGTDERVYYVAFSSRSTLNQSINLPDTVQVQSFQNHFIINSADGGTEDFSTPKNFTGANAKTDT
ncbi:MAG: hypothetical protein CW338_02675, partial [Clostridiales bacterium]|nr:hypothetical protein [Clostridiales bacterium]